VSGVVTVGARGLRGRRALGAWEEEKEKEGPGERGVGGWGRRAEVEAWAGG